MSKNFLFPDLQMFAQGEGEVSPEAGEEITAVAERQDSEVKEDTSDASAPESETAVDDEQLRKAEFERMIKEEYKDLFTQKTQSIINKRFKQTKQLEQRLGEIEPLVDLLALRYGEDSSDIGKIISAAEQDEAYLEQEAQSKGMSVEQLKYVKQLEKENEDFRRAVEERQRIEYADAVYADWMAQAEQTAQEYPDFDLAQESENESFTTLLKAGIPVKTAYEVIHNKQIISSAVEQAKQAVLNDVKASSQRPSDSRVSAAGIVGKKDISALTASDMDEIERRVLRGERITF